LSGISPRRGAIFIAVRHPLRYDSVRRSGKYLEEYSSSCFPLRANGVGERVASASINISLLRSETLLDEKALVV
jgi:hypothetical protein